MHGKSSQQTGSRMKFPYPDNEHLHRLIDNMTINKNLYAFHLRLGNTFALSTLLFNITLEVLTSAIREEKEIT